MKTKRFLLILMALLMVFSFNTMVWASDDPVNEEVTDEVLNEEPGDESAADAVFEDVPVSYWAYKFIMDIYEREITTGTSTDPMTFSPENSLTRAQFVTFLGRLAGVDAAAAAAEGSSFDDISGSNVDYARGYICWAAKIGVTTGTKENEFSPHVNIPREQMATMVMRFANYYKLEMTGGSSDDDIADMASVSDYAKDAVKALTPVYVSLTDGKFSPKVDATRAQMAQILSLIPELGDIDEGGEGEPDDTATDEPVVPDTEN